MYALNTEHWFKIHRLSASADVAVLKTALLEGVIFRFLVGMYENRFIGLRKNKVVSAAWESGPSRCAMTFRMKQTHSQGSLGCPDRAIKSFTWISMTDSQNGNHFPVLKLNTD